MAHRTWTALACTGAAGALLAGMLAPGPVAAAPVAAAEPAAAAAARPAPQPLVSSPVTRLIVRMADRGPVPGSVVAAAARGAGVERAAAARRLAGGAQLVLLSSPVAADRARGLARALAARPDVATAEPDVLLTTADVSPVVPDDPRFGEQWALWDSAAGSPGGYGSHAPAAWARTSGSRDVVVAVVDTGITKHPDLDPNVVPGYDFVSLDDVAPFAGTNLQPLTANDGDGRDADASDPGNWISETEATGLGFFGDRPECSTMDSNWHGTHVAGIVAAVQGNGIGGSGAAPGVTIQPVRAVGKCGGYLSDIADAIRWAAGGTGPTLPAANPTPADVINLSLGGAGTCEAGGYLQQAIDYAHSAGAVVVAAAGNGSGGSGFPVAGDADLGVQGTLPANCANVVAVASVGRDGTRAAYSNYGPEVDLAAPGGTVSANDPAAGILSTFNSGATRPGAPTDRSLAGTSMAAPHVAAAAALLQSTRVGRAPFTPDQVLTELQSLVQPFPDGSCTGATPCGAGILDLAAPLPAALPLPVPGGRADPRESAVELSWQPTPDSGTSGPAEYLVTVTPEGGSPSTLPATAATSLTVDGLANGTSYSFSVVAANDAELQSEPTPLGSATPVADAEALPSRPADVVATPRTAGLTVSWSPSTVPAGAPEVTSYDVQYRVAGSTGWMTGSTATTTFDDDPLAGATYEVQVRGVSSQGAGPWSDLLAVVVPKRSTTATVSGSTVRPFTDGFEDSVGVTIRTNLDLPVTYEVLAPGSAQPIVSEPLGGGGPWSRSFTGRLDGARLPNGVYTLQLRQLNPFSGQVEVVSKRSVTVASTQVATPAVRLSVPTVYWYADGYRDSMSITVPTSVPATQTWRLTNSTGTYTYRTWTFARSSAASTRWTGWGTGSRLSSGTYYLRVTAKGGEGTARTAVAKVTVSAQRLKKERFSRTVFPGSVTVKALNPAAGPPVFTDAAFDGLTRKVLRVYGGYDDATKSGTYDVLSLSAALPSSVIQHTGVAVSTCLRAPVSGWSPPGTNLLGGGYMSTSTRFAGWFSALLDERPVLEGGEGTFTLEPGYIACLKPNLATASAAMAGGRIRWSLFNWAPDPSAFVPVYSFTITGYRYYLA